MCLDVSNRYDGIIEFDYDIMYFLHFGCDRGDVATRGGMMSLGTTTDIYAIAGLSFGRWGSKSSVLRRLWENYSNSDGCRGPPPIP